MMGQKIIERIPQIVGGFLLVFAGTSCYYDVEEELYPTTECLTDSMSFSMDILPIIDANCYTCHSAAINQGFVTLEGYENLKNRVDNGDLLGVLRQESGYPLMPQGGPALLDCEIEKIAAWIADGAKNN